MARSEADWERWRNFQETGKWSKRPAHRVVSPQIAKPSEPEPEEFKQEPLFEVDNSVRPTQEEFDNWINEPGISERHRQGRATLVGNHAGYLVRNR
jgi:hypothetical protein